MMLQFSKVRREHVLRAIEEYDALGASGFLERYHFRTSTSYVLWEAGRSYDSKAVLGVAHLYATGSLPSAKSFNGGKDGAAKDLAKLGFEIIAHPRADLRPRVSTDAVGRVCPECFVELPTLGECDNCS